MESNHCIQSVNPKEIMVYLASPFFNPTELETVKMAEQILQNKGFSVFSPRLHEIRNETQGTPEWSRKTFAMDRSAILECSVMVLLYWGNYSDTGTAWECGYAYAQNKPILIVHLGNDSNLMIHESCHANLKGLKELEAYDFSQMPKCNYIGPML